MSVDGADILESDLAHDIYNNILDLYDSNISIDDIFGRISVFEQELTDETDVEIYLSASALALWEIGQLDEQRVRRLSSLMESGEIVMRWQQFTDSDFARTREKALSRLLRKVGTPRKNPRKRKAHGIVKHKLFELGDCVQVTSENAVHSGVICKIHEHRGHCEYFILVMAPIEGTAVKSFVEGSFFGQRIPSFAEDGSKLLCGPHVIRPEHRMLLRAGNPFHIVGHVDLDEAKFMPGSWGGILEMKHVIEDFERTEANRIPRKTLIPLRELLTAP